MPAPYTGRCPLCGLRQKIKHTAVSNMQTTPISERSAPILDAISADTPPAIDMDIALVGN